MLHLEKMSPQRQDFVEERLYLRGNYGDFEIKKETEKKRDDCPWSIGSRVSPQE